MTARFFPTNTVQPKVLAGDKSSARLTAHKAAGAGGAGYAVATNAATPTLRQPSRFASEDPAPALQLDDMAAEQRPGGGDNIKARGCCSLSLHEMLRGTGGLHNVKCMRAGPAGQNEGQACSWLLPPPLFASAPAGGGARAARQRAGARAGRRAVRAAPGPRRAACGLPPRAPRLCVRPRGAAGCLAGGHLQGWVGVLQGWAGGEGGDASQGR